MNPALGVTAAAYTNNDADPNTATTLFDIDTSLDQVTVQAPPNAGTLNPTGKLLVDVSSPVGFDIYSTIVSSGTTVDNDAFASLTISSGSAFYSIDPLTGRATKVGSFRVPVVDIAIPLTSADAGRGEGIPLPPLPSREKGLQPPCVERSSSRRS